MNPIEDLLCGSDAAKLLGKSPSAVCRAAKAGRLPVAAYTTRGHPLFREEEIRQITLTAAPNDRGWPMTATTTKTTATP